MKEVILNEKRCMNCEYGITIPGHRYECCLKKDGIYVHKDAYCPITLNCEHWKVDFQYGMEDMSERWKNPIVIDVD